MQHIKCFLSPPKLPCWSDPLTNSPLWFTNIYCFELSVLIVFCFKSIKRKKKNKGKKLEMPNFIFKVSNAGRLQLIFPSNISHWEKKHTHCLQSKRKLSNIKRLWCTPNCFILKTENNYMPDSLSLDGNFSHNVFAVFNKSDTHPAELM